MCIITFFLYNKNAIVFDFTVYGCKMIKMTAINTSILMDGLRTDEIDGNYVQVFVINIYSAFRSCFFFLFCEITFAKIWSVWNLIFFLNIFWFVKKKSHYHIHRQSNKYTTAQLGKYKKKLIISSIIKIFWR